jgi:hypothetical protein
MFTAVDNCEIISEIMYLGLIEAAVTSGARALLVF